MTTEEVPAELRRRRIVDLAREREFVRVSELATNFGLTEVTIRADLDLLAAEGKLQRVHGGAIFGRSRSVERKFEDSAGTEAVEKRAIARHVASMIESGQVVLLDVGSTAAAIARAIARRSDLHDVLFVTNGIKVALELENVVPRNTVVVTGGTLRPIQHSLVDPLATAALERIKADLAVVGCSGVHITGGITNVNLPECEVKRSMLRRAGRAVVAADGTKVGAVSVARVGSIDEIDLLVTGKSADPATVAELREAGLETKVVS